MEEFNIVNWKLQKLASLKNILQKVTAYIPELQCYINKIDSMIDTIEDGEISIVLLGCFSDGKTSAIAGLLGRLEDNMKIDSDESSDELTVYRPKNFRSGFKIVDTPGLFGTKEREIDGRSVKFSEITERYISEAHIIIYVCDAVVPLKDSHAEIVRRVMRDYHKLDNTIFVINKMDEAGYDLRDEYDFNNGCKIKKENLITRLRSTINLSPEEEKRLHIVCIAADPNGKGLAHWFTKINDYYERSHIKDLRKCVNEIVSDANKNNLSSDAYEASVDDVIGGLCKVIVVIEKPMAKTLENIENDNVDIEEDLKRLKTELMSSREDLIEAIKRVKDDVIRDIRGASLETISEVVDNQLGVQNGQVTFYVFKARLNVQIERCCETNNNRVNLSIVNINNICSKQDSMFGEMVKKGTEILENLNISGDQVKMARDFVAKNYKFKPWGAIKLGKNISKWAGRAGAGIEVAFEGYSLYQRKKENEKLEEHKQKLCNAVNDSVANIFKEIESEAEFYKNYAPSYLNLCQKFRERNEEIDRLKHKIAYLEKFKRQIDLWRNSAEYVDFEEI